MGKLVPDVIVDIGLLVNFGELKMEVKQKCGYYLLGEMYLIRLSDNILQKSQEYKYEKTNQNNT